MKRARAILSIPVLGAALCGISLASHAQESTDVSRQSANDKSPCRTPTTEARTARWEQLTPGESTRQQVIEALGEPQREWNVATADGFIPVRLLPRQERDEISRELGRRIAPEHTVWLRVLRYLGDERREFYAAVLKDGILHYTIEPTLPSERDLERLKQRYGEPTIERSPEVVLRTKSLTPPYEDHLVQVNVVSTAWYPEQGLGFISGPADRADIEGFTGKVRLEPSKELPRTLDEKVFEPAVDTSGAAKGSNPFEGLDLPE